MRSNINYGMVRGRSSDQHSSFPGRPSITRQVAIFLPPALDEINYQVPLTMRTPYSRASSQTPIRKEQYSRVIRSHSRDLDTLSSTRPTELPENYKTISTIEKGRNNTLLSEIHRLEGIIGEKRTSEDLLRQKEIELESRIKLLIEENERLSGLVDQYSNEAEIWKTKYNELAKNLGTFETLSYKKQEQDIDNERFMSSRRGRSIDDRVIRGGSVQSRSINLRTNGTINDKRFGAFGVTFEERRKELEEVEKRALMAVEGQTQEIERWRFAYEKLEIQFIDLQKEYDKLKRRTEGQEQASTKDIQTGSETEEKFKLLLVESERLQRLVEELQNERGVLFKRLAELESLRFQMKSLEENILLLVTENEKLGGSLGKAYEKPLRSQTKMDENEREMLVKRITELENVVQSTLELKDKVLLLADQNEHLNNELKRKDIEIEQRSNRPLEKQERSLEETEFEKKAQLFLKEKDGLQKLLLEKEEESKLWKARYFEVEERNIDLSGELTRFKEQFKDVQKKLEILNAQKENCISIIEKERDSNEIRQKLARPLLEQGGLDQKVNLMVIENEKLNSAIEQHLKQIEVLQDKCNMLEDEIILNKESQDNLKSVMLERERKIEFLISENVQLNKAIENQERIKQEKNQLEGKNKQLTFELLQNNTQSVIKHQKEELEEKVLFLISENAKLHNEIESYNQIKSEKEEIEEKLDFLIDEKLQLQNTIKSLMSLKQQKDDLEEKTKALIFENSQLQNEIRSRIQAEQEKEKLEEKVKQLNFENQHLGHNLTQSRIQLKQHTEELESKLQLIISENEKLNKEAQSHYLLKLEKDETEEKLRHFRDENIQLKNFIENTQNKLRKENEELIEKNQNLTKEIVQLQNVMKSHSITQRQKEELEEKNKVLFSENTKLHKENAAYSHDKLEKIKQEEHLKNLISENQQLKKDLSQIQILFQHRQEELEEKIKLLVSENMKLYRDQESSQILNNEIHQTKEKLLLSTSENKRLLDEVDPLLRIKKEKVAQDEKIQSLTFEINQLNIKLKSYSSIQLQKEQLEEKVKTLCSENINLHNEIKFGNVQNLEKGELEAKLKSVRSENLQLQQSLIEKMQQIDDLQNMCYDLENENSQIEGLKRKIEHLNKEINRLNGSLQEKELLEEKINLVIRENENLHEMTSSQKNLIEEYQSKLAQLEGDNRLSQSIKSESFAIKEELENQVNFKEMEILQLKGIIQQNQAQINDLQQNYKKLDSENIILKQNEYEFVHQKEIYLDQIQQLKNEEKRLENILQDQMKKLESQQTKSIELEFENNKLKLLEKEKEFLNKERERMQKSLQENETEKENYRNEITNLKREIDSLSILKKKVEMLSAENERLEELLGDSQNKIDEWEQKHRGQETKMIQLEELNWKITNLNKDKEDLNKEILRAHDEKEEWIIKYRTLRDENEVLQSKIGIMTKENTYLTSSNTQKLEEIEGLKVTISQQQDLKSKTIELQEKLNAVIDENTQLNRTLDERIKEFDRNRGIIEENLYSKDLASHELRLQTNNLFQENTKLETKIIELTSELTTWKNKLDQAKKTEAMTEALEQKLLTLTSENERLRNEIRRKNQHIDELEKGEAMNHVLKNEIRELSTQNEDLKRKNSILKEDIQRSHEKLKVWNSNEKLSNKSPSISQYIFEKPQQTEEKKKANPRNYDDINQLHYLSEEKERLEHINNDLLRELELWKEKCSILEKEAPKPKLSKTGESKFGKLLRENSELIQMINETANNSPNQQANLGSIIKKSTMFDQLQASSSKGIKEVTSERIARSEKSPPFEDKESEEDGEDNNEDQEEVDVDALDDEERIGLLIEEVEKLERKLLQKNKVVELLKNRILDMESCERENDEIKQQLEILFAENKKLNTLFENQQKDYNEKIRNSASKNSYLEFEENNEYEDELSTKVITLNTEVERLNRLVKERDQEIEHLRSRNMKTSNESHFEMRIKFLENENKNMHNDLLRKIEETENLRSELINVNKKLSSAERNYQLFADFGSKNKIESVENDYNQTQNVNELVKQLEDIISHLQKKNKDLETHLRDRTDELDLIKGKTINNQNDVNKTSNQAVENLKMRIVLLCSEIERLTFLLELQSSKTLV